MPTQKFFLKDLQHDAEAGVVERLRSVPGVLFAAASHQDQCVEVEFEDDAITTAELRETLSGMGYRADLAG